MTAARAAVTTVVVAAGVTSAAAVAGIGPAVAGRHRVQKALVSRADSAGTLTGQPAADPVRVFPRVRETTVVHAVVVAAVRMPATTDGPRAVLKRVVIPRAGELATTAAPLLRVVGTKVVAMPVGPTAPRVAMPMTLVLIGAATPVTLVVIGAATLAGRAATRVAGMRTPIAATTVARMQAPIAATPTPADPHQGRSTARAVIGTGLPTVPAAPLSVPVVEVDGPIGIRRPS